MTRSSVLVTAIGSMSSECVIGSLRNIGCQVVGTDFYPLSYNPIALSCRAFSRMPMASDATYCTSLLAFAKSTGCTMIWPLTDPEVDVLAKHRVQCEAAGVRICLPEASVIADARNKMAWSTSLLSGAKAFRTVPSYDSYWELCQNWAGDYVAKRICGRSSEGILFSDTEAGAPAVGDGYFFQPFVRGDICTVDFVRHPLSGEIVCVPRTELLRTKNGAGTVVRIESPEAYIDAVTELVERLNLSGVMNCEFIRDEDGVLWLIDINPRFSAGVAFSLKAGYDFVRAHLDCYASDVLVRPGKIAVGSIFVKRYREV